MLLSFHLTIQVNDPGRVAALESLLGKMGNKTTFELHLPLWKQSRAGFAQANARVSITRLGSRGRRADALGDGEWDGLGGAGVFAEGNRPL